MAKFKIEVNDLNNIRDLLQETYALADAQLVQAQDQITKLATATKLHECTMDEKAKYAKAQNDYLSIKDKAISKKLEIAKLLNEIVNHNGNDKKLDDKGKKQSGFDLSKIKAMVDESYNTDNKVELKLTKK